MGRTVAALGRGIGFGHVLHNGIGSAESTDEQGALVADHGGEPVVFVERVGGGAGAGFLAQSEVDSTDNLALLVKIFESDLHFAIEQHVAVDFDGLLLVEVFGIADRWDGGGAVDGDFVTDMFLALAIFFRELADFELRVLQAVVGDVVGAEVFLAAAVFARASLGGRRGVRPYTSGGGPGAVTRGAAVGRHLGCFLVLPHVGGAWARCIDGIARVGERARARVAVRRLASLGLDSPRAVATWARLCPRGFVFFMQVAEFGWRLHGDAYCSA